MDIEIKGGTLSKRSRNRSTLSALSGVNWQLRRISLTETRVAYGTVDGPPKDFVPISSNTVGEAISIDGKDFVFKITTGSEELILQAANEEDRKQWLAAIAKAANPPPPAPTGNAEADKLAAEMEKVRLEAHRHAEEQAHAAQVAHSHTLGGVLGGAATAVVHGLENAAHAAEQAAAAEAEKLLKLKRVEEERVAAELAAVAAAQAAAAAAAKRQLYASLSAPVACNKKLSTESKYQPRFIWIKEDTKEFHWGKTADGAKSKCVSITNHVVSVRSNTDVTTPNFTIELQNVESIFTGLFASVPSSIDVTMEDVNLVNGFMQVIAELKA